jgi:voltage-gated potassium channel Kch
MKKASIRERVRYWFDNTMAKGPIALISWLGLFTLVVIVITSLVVWVTGFQEEESLGEQIWSFTMLSLDLDSLTSVPWFARVATLVIVFTSIFVTSTLIGVLTTGLEGKMEDLRKGRSRVIEADHTVLLGWSPVIFPIISEIIVANANQRNASIVVLADRDKVTMEEEIADRVGDTGSTRIICRRGDPMEMGDLEIASLNSSKSIVILAPIGEDPDSVVIKIMLAITKNPMRRSASYHIVAEMNDPKNLEVARIVGKDEAEFVLTGRLIARIAAQTSRQSGLSIVYGELMDFAGDEIYFQVEPRLVGRHFAEALLSYEDSAVIGLQPRNAPPKLNPPMETLIMEGDQIIAISEDDDTVRLSARAETGIDHNAIQAEAKLRQRGVHTLILGWNRHAPTLVEALDHYVSPGSRLTIMAEVTQEEAEKINQELSLENQSSIFITGDTTDRKRLEGFKYAEIDHVIVLSYSDALETQRADAKTLITLIHLRDVSDHAGYTFSMVSEMLDVRNRDLAEVARADDFIVSDRLVSLILAQISENKALSPVFTDLFDPDGSEIYLKPASRYVKLGTPVNFYTVVVSASQMGEVAFGYRLNEFAYKGAQAYGVVINPNKSENVAFGEEDKIIVLAEK